MTTRQVLQHLYPLDTSSPDLPRLLDGLIWHDEREQYLSTLRGSELARLVDFLHGVRALLPAFRPVTKILAGSQRHPNHRRAFPTMFL